jgi:hypothetical protein
MRKFKVLFFIFLLFQLSIGNSNSQTKIITPQSSEKKDWILSDKYGFPVWLALNATPPKDGVQLRRIFLLLEDKNFNAEDLKKVFLGLSAENPSPSPRPEALDIIAFSDAAMLQREIKAFLSGICVFVSPDTPEGRKYYERTYALPSGYFRAFYYRSWEGAESYRWSPDPDKEDYVKIILKN